MPAKRGPKAKTAQNSKRKPAAKPAKVVPPAHLTPEERDTFKAVATKLRAFGVLERTDPTLIELYAVNYQLLCQAREAVGVDGLTSTTRFGSLSAHPLLNVIAQTTVRLKGILNDLGLTPAAAKLAAPEGRDSAKPSDPWEGILNVVG
jgi:P27 family predicted phage terminase small subunit